MSRVILAKPVSSPASLRMGSMTTLAQKKVRQQNLWVVSGSGNLARA
jgi:hypothetical protein